MQIEKLEPDRRDLVVLNDWKNCYENSSYYLEKWGTNFLKIEYENLVKDPVLETKKICEFLRISWNKEIINSDKFTDDLGIPWKANSSFSVLNGISPQHIYNYDNLSEEELSFVSAYEKNSISENSIAFLQSKFENYSNKMHRALLAAGRYNVALFSSSVQTLDLASCLHQCYLSNPTLFTHDSNIKQKPKFDVVSLSNLQISCICNEPALIDKFFPSDRFDFIHLDNEQFFTYDVFHYIKHKYNKKIIITNGKNVDIRILSLADMTIANSEEEKTRYMKSIDHNKILIKSELLENMPNLYRRFILKNMILYYNSNTKL